MYLNLTENHSTKPNTHPQIHKMKHHTKEGKTQIYTSRFTINIKASLSIFMPGLERVSWISHCQRSPSATALNSCSPAMQICSPCSASHFRVLFKRRTTHKLHLWAPSNYDGCWKHFPSCFPSSLFAVLTGAAAQKQKKGMLRQIERVVK